VASRCARNSWSGYKTNSLTNPIVGCQLVCILFFQCIVGMVAHGGAAVTTTPSRGDLLSLGATWQPRQTVETFAK
jgi:hypothetical protein